MEQKTINEDLKNLGVNQESLSKDDKTKLDQGEKTGLLQLSIVDSKENRDLLKNENVPYKVEDGRLSFEGKVSILKTLTTDNTTENQEALKSNEIKFKEEGNKLTLDNKNIKKFAIAALVLINPIAAAVLLLYPKRSEIKNDRELSKEEIKLLKTGETLARTDKNNERVLLQVDRETNELVSVKLKDISIPDKINGETLSPMQKENLKNGKEIQLQNNKGEAITAKLDLNEKSGLLLKDEKGQRIESKTKNDNHLSNETTKAVPTKAVPVFENDAQRLVHVQNMGYDGMKDIYRNSPAEHDQFLKKYNLKESFQKHNNEIQNAAYADSSEGRTFVDYSNSDEMKKIAEKELIKLNSIDLNKGTGLDIKNEKQEDKSLLNKVVSFGQDGIKYTVDSIQNGKAKLEQLDNKDYGVSKTQIVDLDRLKDNAIVHENKNDMKRDQKISDLSFDKKEEKSRGVKI